MVHHDTPVYGRWWTSAIASGVVAAGGGFCAWREQVAQKDYDDLGPSPEFSKATTIRERGENWALATNISFGVAGAALVTSVLVGLLHHGDEPTVLVAPTPTGATAVLRF